MNPFRVAVLGAPGTGKTQLANDLTAALTRDKLVVQGRRAIVIDDDPLTQPREGNRSSQNQQPNHDGLAQLSAFDLVLLMGLDLPSSTQSLDADITLRSMLSQATVDYRVVYGTGQSRAGNALACLKAIRTLFPAPKSIEALTTNAAPRTARIDDRAALSTSGAASDSASRVDVASRWTWACDKCSDPVCEHEMFTRLLSDRLAKAA